MTEESVLSYYKEDKATRLVVDAGPNGLGCVLLQAKSGGMKTVACYSRSLTYVEQRYSQTEREALAIRLACERCYMYLFGSEFIIKTDHKPLVPLLNNPNSNLPMRIERWLMYLPGP